MTQNRGFIHGAMLLTGAAVASKLLGSIYTIALQNVIGDHGMGLFQMAYPIYATLLAIATAGFPVAISKLVSERLALGDWMGARQTFRVSFGLLSAAGVITFVLLFFGASTWANLAGDAAAAPVIRAIAPALFVVPIMSALRGYFQGYQWMAPTASSQVVEQLVRVCTIVGLSAWLMYAGYGESAAAAGAAFGAVTGAAAGLAWLTYIWYRNDLISRRSSNQHPIAFLPLVKRLLYYAFPISLGALVVPLMNNVDVVTVVNLLKSAGFTQTAATTEFGLLSGRAFKLLMLPTTLAAGIGIAVMPAISEAFTLGHRSLLSSRIHLAMRLTIYFAMPSAVGLILLAGPVDIALFKNLAGAPLIRVIGAAVLFASVQTTTAAILQGSGIVYWPVLNLLLAGLVKLAGNLFLVPSFHAAGAAMATVMSYGTAMVLNLWVLRKYLNEQLDIVDWVLKPGATTFIMAAAVVAMAAQADRFGWLRANRIIIAGITAAIVGLAAIIYLFGLLLTSALTKDELSKLPKVGPQLVSLCARLGILRT